MTNKKYYNFLIFACTFLWVMWACFFMYVLMMGSKNVYTAELVEIGNIFNVNKSQASLAMTYYFVTYSIAQIVLFFFMDNINLKWFMTISIFLSGIVTVFVAFMTSMWKASAPFRRSATARLCVRPARWSKIPRARWRCRRAK